MSDDFWMSSGHHLLDHDAHGYLTVSDEFLKAYLARPEIKPPEDACAAERDLYARLLAHPRQDIVDADIAAISDRDGRENWAVFRRFRNLLLAHSSLEAAYLAQLRSKDPPLPWLFANQLTHLILRNALDGVEDPLILKTAELFFRRQKLSRRNDMLLLADADLVEDRQAALHASPLLAMFQDGGTGDLDIFDETTAGDYRRRSDAFDLVLDFRAKGAGRAAFARVMEIWVRHLLGISVKVEPLESVANVRFAWFVGLDQEATRIGNALWDGQEPAHHGRERILALYRMIFVEPHVMLERVDGEAVYLILAVDGDQIVHMKPQNLITGLPLKAD